MLAQSTDMSPGEALLVGHQHVYVGGADPLRKHAFDVNDAARAFDAPDALHDRAVRNSGNVYLHARRAHRGDQQFGIARQPVLVALDDDQRVDHLMAHSLP